MNSRKAGKRLSCQQLQNKSSARVIIVDIASSSAPGYIETLSISLSEFLTLHHSLPGPSRISLFSFYLIGSYTECVTYLQCLKQNFNKILNATRALKVCENMVVEKTRTSSSFQENLSSVLIESLISFQELLKTGSKASNLPSQIDFCLFTEQNQSYVEKEVAKLLQENDLSSVKKVQIVHVSCSHNYEVASSNESTGSADSGTTETLCRYVETLFVENNAVSFDQFFKSWLQENGLDDVNLNIQFTDFSIKCDLMDKIINPLYFPRGKCLLIESELNNHSIAMASVCKPKPSTTEGVYHLKPKLLIKAENLCESLLFGFPMVAKPTTCWKLEWEELEKNQNNFFSLTAYLSRQGMVMLLEHADEPSIRAYFLLVPSSGGTMLIKSIATRELILPDKILSTVNLNGHTISVDVERALKQISIESDYNPFDFTCGLLSQISFKHSSGADYRYQKKPSSLNSFDIPGESCTMWSSGNGAMMDRKKSLSTIISKDSIPAHEKNLLDGAKDANTRSVSPYYVKQSQNSPALKRSMLISTDLSPLCKQQQQVREQQKKRYVPRFTSLPKPLPVTNVSHFSQSIVRKNKACPNQSACKKKKSF